MVSKLVYWSPKEAYQRATRFQQKRIMPQQYEKNMMVYNEQEPCNIATQMMAPYDELKLRN